MTQTPVAYSGTRVRLQNISPYWDGKTGTVVKWSHDQWYTVRVEGSELLLDAGRGEFEIETDPDS